LDKRTHTQAISVKLPKHLACQTLCKGRLDRQKSGLGARTAPRGRDAGQRGWKGEKNNYGGGTFTERVSTTHRGTRGSHLPGWKKRLLADPPHPPPHVGAGLAQSKISERKKQQHRHHTENSKKNGAFGANIAFLFPSASHPCLSFAEIGIGN